MRLVIIPLLALFSFSACSSYQYMTIDSSELRKNDQHQFVFENDTIRVLYDFNGPGGPISLNIYNKSTQPLYVNWKKSALIRDSMSTSLFDRNVLLTGGSSSVSYRFGHVNTSSSTFAGSFTLPEGMDFIPPGSSIAKGLVPLAQSGQLTAYIPDTVHKQTSFDNLGDKNGSYRQMRFDEAGSPLKFKSYITFVLGSNNAVEFAQTSSFYVGEVLEANRPPADFALYKEEGDKLFVRHSGQ